MWEYFLLKLFLVQGGGCVYEMELQMLDVKNEKDVFSFFSVFWYAKILSIILFSCKNICLRENLLCRLSGLHLSEYACDDSLKLIKTEHSAM